MSYQLSEFERKQIISISVENKDDFNFGKNHFLAEIKGRIPAFNQLDDARSFYTWLADYKALWYEPQKAEKMYRELHYKPKSISLAAFILFSMSMVGGTLIGLLIGCGLS